MDCPKCKSECFREDADVGVGIIYGPYGCTQCGWSEDPYYDSSSGPSEAEREHLDYRVTPQGGLIPKRATSPLVKASNLMTNHIGAAPDRLNEYAVGDPNHDTDEIVRATRPCSGADHYHG